MKFAGIAILVALSGFLGLLKVFETQLTYPLDPTPVTPAEVGLAMTEIRLEALDRVEIVVWQAEAAEGRPTLLYFQGNAGHLGHRARRFSILLRNGFGIMALAYRGSGGTEGTASEEALRGDALLLAEYAGVHVGPVAYYGESLGTGVASWLATEHPPSRLVIEAPYTSIPDAALKTQAPDWARALFANHWDTRSHIAQVTAPLLVLHGEDDEVIPVEQGQAVFDLAASHDKALMRLPGIGHNNVWQPEVQAAIVAFLLKG